MLKSLSGWTSAITSNPMVERRKLRAVARAVRWQVTKRIGAKRALVTVGPARFYCYPENRAASGALYTGFMEFDEMAFAVRFLRAGDGFIDVGANVGTFSVFAASFVPGVLVTSVEPDQPTRARLYENLEVNGLSCDRIIGKALAAEPGTARFSTGRDTLNALSDDEGSVEIEVTTLDQLAAAELPALIKVDVEGAELGVFEGATQILESTDAPVLIFEVNGYCRNFGVEPEQIYTFLTARGFSLFEYDGNANALIEFPADGLPKSQNLVAAKNPNAVRERLSENWPDNELKSVPIGFSLNW